MVQLIMNLLLNNEKITKSKILKYYFFDDKNDDQKYKNDLVKYFEELKNLEFNNYLENHSILHDARVRFVSIQNDFN